MSRNKESRNRRTRTAGLTRRQFLTYSAAAGVLAGSSPLMAAQDQRRPGRPPHGGLNRRTLFFNFAHEPDAAKARYFLVAAGRRYPLHRVRKGSAVLRRARRRNQFLRQLPDSALTHVVENVFFSTGVVHLCYVIKDPDTTTGTWSMSSMFFQLPASSVLNAFELGVDRFGTESFPVSAKRQLYRLGPAMTSSDLLEEEALKDSTDHATAIIGVHPELLSAEPDSAADIQKNFVAMSGATIALSMELQSLGPATPQLMPNQPNSSGWATLTPVTDENGQPFKNQQGNNQGLIQYHPDWNPEITPLAGSGVSGVMNPVKNDAKLGADVTGLDPNAPNTNLTGRIWQRHDGFTTVDQSPMAGDAVEDSVKFTLTTQNTETGYSCKGTASAQSDGTVEAMLTFTNWYVRWLGIYLLFLDANGNPLDASGVKVTTPPDYDPKEDRGKLASEKAVFGLLLGPEFTVLGVPVAHSTATVTFNLPEEVSSVRVFASGPNLHFNTPPDPNDPSTWGDPLPGWLITALVNYGVTMLLMGAGATQDLSPIQKAALPLAASIVVDVINLIGDDFRNKDFGQADAWQQVGLATLKALLTSLTGRAVAELAGLIALAITEGEAEDAIPIAGQIAMGVSLLAGAATLLETTMEIAASPISYVYDLVLTHDLSVTILHDPKNNQFPAVANYYKVTALFDNGGTPHVQKLDMPGGNVSTLPPVVFRDVPLGGKVNVSVGFYSRSADRTQNDWLAAKGTTGLVDNTVGQEPKITIEQFPVPIRSNTIYEHKQKTALVDAQGNHRWVTAPAPTVKVSDCENHAGALCKFRAITVRQGTSVPPAPGYVGYAWQGFSTGVVGCASGGQGQLDQLANLGVVDPQSGYVTAPCGLEPRTQLTYSLLTRGTSNFYLDSTNNVVRRVQLDPTPEFDNPTNMQQAWGALNLASDALLLHPSDRLVSINNANSKIEVLKIPDAPVTVEEARAKLLANVYSGQGSRPGLIDAPSAAAVSPQGVILILEGNNSRLQAFDLGGNPVQFFKNQQMPYFLNLEATASGDTVYHDLAVEFTGYLYVLSSNQGVYRLDIYHPDQTDTNPISTTQNVSAAKLTVDFWRNVYTLNYEVLKLPDGMVPSITEPSVSQWVPSTP